ncbi:hypothetical protein CABS02_13390 [Colletotrichum abscissum]|uniref:Uncharacterized protein n=1 Tax=Colletotrichum abscissum TaxID=1671311 RepID=A0A9P9X330_9PEZI|nr:hypothetical protein CABS02_13390 [Colletotrichum abscissum]
MDTYTHVTSVPWLRFTTKVFHARHGSPSATGRPFSWRIRRS